MSLPYFPMYPTDFEAKTSHLTLEEDGAYNRLLRLMWMTPGCTLPDDDAWIMRRMRVDADTYERVVRVVIDEFCDRENGRVSNAKLMRVFDESMKSHNKRVLAGAKGGKNKALKTNKNGSSNAVAKPKQPEPEPEPKERDKSLSTRVTRFNEFWQVYPHRGGVKRNRKGSLQKYAAAVKRGVAEETLIEAAKVYAKDRRVIEGYARDPVTWLNQEGWTDEPAPSQQNGGYDPQQDKWDYIAKHGSSAGWRSANA